MSHILHMIEHPRGWWWLVDLVVLGVSGTIGVALGNDDR